MKVKILGALLLASVLMTFTVSAMAVTVQSEPIKLVQKSILNGVLKNNVTGEVIFTYNSDFGKVQAFSQTARATVYNLQPNTDYTLIYIYYGPGINTNVWSAACITSGKTSTQGYVKMVSGKIEWMPFLNDGRAQRFWVIPSSDINCSTKQMIAWNPGKYLFGTATL